MCLCALIMSSCVERPKKNSAFYYNLGSEPTTLHPLKGATEAVTGQVGSYVIESLLTRDIDTYEWKPVLAKSWKVSKDKLKFTYKLRDDVYWHDGVKFTAKDVKFSFDAIFDDKYQAAAIRSYFEGIEKVEIVDDYTVIFHAKDKNYQNFSTASTLDILPKHFYEQDEKKSFFNKNLVGTGPYKLDLYKRGNRIVLVKNDKWWGNKIKGQDEWNFPKIVLRFISDQNVALEMLKKGSLDYLGLRAEEYVKKARGPIWGKKVHKVETKNSTPKGYNFIGWNLRHPILKDKQVRKALYHLVNRDLMIKKFEYNYTTPLDGPVYPQSPYAVDVKTVKFDPKKALKMLKSAGWKDTNGDNILDKVIDGKKRSLSITILEPWEGFTRYLTIFKEDARRAGVEINIKVMEWNSFIKLVDERKFDAIRLAWNASVDWNPTQIWHSKSIKGGSNFIGFSNKRVDEIADKAKYIHDKEKRIELLKEAQRIIIDEAPYVWFTNKSTTMYGYTDRIEREKDTYKFGIGYSKWKFKSKMRKGI